MFYLLAVVFFARKTKKRKTAGGRGVVLIDEREGEGWEGNVGRLQLSKYKGFKQSSQQQGL